MPIYEYECAGCGHRLEAIQRHTEAPLKDCPDCGKSRLKKLISVAGFRLSGKGWYETDFKDNKQKNLSRKDSAEDNAGAKINDKSSEAKNGESKSVDKSTEKKSAKADKSSADSKKTKEPKSSRPGGTSASNAAAN